MLIRYLSQIGRYFLMLKEIFNKQTKWSVMRNLIFKEIDDLIIGSLGIVAFISFFVGGVVSIQTALNLTNPLIPKYLIGFATRQSVILEFAPTFISVIMAGKMGSFITSSIGTMRVTEQIDALEIMGVNSLTYLVLPKIAAAVIFFPVLIVFSMVLSMLGGWLALMLSGLITTDTYILGIRSFFEMKHVWYALTKTVVFGFLIVSIASFYGYYTKGGSLDVGRSSTQAVVSSSIAILISNFFLTQMILLS